MGLLRPSFVPPPEIRALRDLTRTRLQLVRDRSREWQRLEKLLEGALVKLSSVVHSLAKVQSARAILEAIAAGERDPKALAALAHPNVKGGRAAVEEALGGMALGDHHPMLIRVHLDHITLLDRSVAEVEDEIEAALDAIPAAWGTDPGGETGPDAGRGPDPAVLPAAERLAEIPGVSPALARAIIAETGLDMTRFQTADHLVSWAGLAPVARQSGPRSRKPKKRTGRRLPARLLHPGRQRRRPHRHLPRRTAPPPVQAPRRQQGQVRRRPLHPRHRLAPARQPRRQVRRPRPRLAPAQNRHRPPHPQPHEPAPRPPPRRRRQHQHRPGNCRLKPKPPLTRPAAQSATGR